MLLLYINGLSDVLLSSWKDMPTVNSVPSPDLLYAVDAVLISQTPSGLKGLIVNFVKLMDKLDLEANSLYGLWL